MRPASEKRFLSGYRTDAGTSSSYAAYSEIKNDGDHPANEAGRHRNRWVPGIVYNPAQNRKKQSLNSNTTGVNSRCFIAIERWIYPEETLN
jgi:hypothetical protein